MAPPSPGQLWATIRSARLIQVLVVYLGASFVVLEAIDVLTEQLGLPDWVFPGAVILLLIGLPIMMATAIVQGIQAAAPKSGGDGVPAGEGGEDEGAPAAAPGPTAPAPAEAIENMRAWDGRLGCPICALPLLAVTYDRAGLQDSALTLYERFVTTPYSSRMSHPWTLPGALERLGELYEAHGDTQKATYYYGKFAELWKDADPELQPRVVAARRAITALSSDK